MRRMTSIAFAVSRRVKRRVKDLLHACRHIKFGERKARSDWTVIKSRVNSAEKKSDRGERRLSALPSSGEKSWPGLHKSDASK